MHQRKKHTAKTEVFKMAEETTQEQAFHNVSITELSIKNSSDPKTKALNKKFYK